MKLLLINVLILGMLLIQNSQASVDQALTAANDFDNLYGDTISEGNVGKIEVYKAFTVIIGADVTVRLTNDYQTEDDTKSTLECTLKNDEILGCRDLKTGKEI